MKDMIQALLEECESKSLYAVMNFVAHPLFLQAIRQSAKLKAQVYSRLEDHYEQLLKLSALPSQQDLINIQIQLNHLKVLLLEMSAEQEGNTKQEINLVGNSAKQNDS